MNKRVGLAVLVLAVVVGLLVWQRGRPPEQPAQPAQPAPATPPPVTAKPSPPSAKPAPSAPRQQAAPAGQAKPQPERPRPAPAPAEAPAVVSRNVSVIPSAPRVWRGPLNSGQTVGAGFVDGGLQLARAEIPREAAQTAPAGSSAMLLLNIEHDGGVSGGRVLVDTTGVGPALLEAAKSSWRFKPLTVNGVPVRTATSVRVQF